MNTCGQCKHWTKAEGEPPQASGPRLQESDGKGKAMGDCRRYPPTVELGPVPRSKFEPPGPPRMGRIGIVPPVSANFPACGEFQPRGIWGESTVEEAQGDGDGGAS